MNNFSGWIPKSKKSKENTSKDVKVPEKFQRTDCNDPPGPSGVKPIRIILLLLTLVLFAFVVYMTAMDSSPLKGVSSILLIILTSIYVFVLAMDVISQFGGAGITESPMLVFSILGVLLFATAGLIIFYLYELNGHWELLVSFPLCLAIAILFLLELFLILVHWRRKCNSATKCYPCAAAHTCVPGQLRTLYQQDNDNRPVDSDISKYDATTSVSSCRQAPVIEDTMDPMDVSHAYRKIEKAHRRQYVDCQSSVPSVATCDIAQVQTDRTSCLNTEIQTQDIDGSSTCTCHIKSCTPIYSPCLRPAACAPCTVYPTIMHLMHHTDLPMSASCCSDCKTSGTIEVHQEEMQRQEGPVRENASTSVSRTNLIIEECRPRLARKMPRVYETRPCPTHGSGLAATLAGLPLPVTTVTLPDCYVRRNKRTQTPKQSVSSNRDSKTASADESSKRQEIKKESDAEVAEEKLEPEEVKEGEGVSEKEQQLPAEKTAEEKSLDKENQSDFESGTIGQRSEGSSSREISSKRSSKIFQKKNKVDHDRSVNRGEEKMTYKTCGCFPRPYQTRSGYCAKCGRLQVYSPSRL